MFDNKDRLSLLEGKVDVITREVNEMLKQLSQTVISIVETHRLFTQFITARVDELEKGAQGGKGIEVREDETGREI